MGGVSYYEAAAYARFTGKRLPTSTHWLRAALRHNRDISWLVVPASNLNAAQPRRAGLGMLNAYAMYDVAGNVREWCVNLVDAGRLTRGAGWEDSDFHVSHLIPKPDFDRSPSNGFRLVSLSDHDTTIAHVAGRVVRAVPRDFSKVSTLSDSEFRIYRRLFDYDNRPLEARRDTTGVGEHYRWEKVSFAAPYGGERMAAYLLLPKDAKPPYEAVIWWPGSNAMTLRSFDPVQAGVETLTGFLPRSGRAVVLPVFKGSFERDDSMFSTVVSVPDGTTYYRDLAVQRVKDFRRTVDYLATRDDIAADKLGLLGHSWGGEIGPVALAVEPRIKAAVMLVGGYWPVNTPAREVETHNYVPRVRTPILLLNGRHDIVFPYETSQLPFFRQLGTAAADKKHVVYNTSHTVPQNEFVRETLAWFDRYLSGRSPAR